ncbi:hypothetical protein BJX70DRAFT_409880 [Aspergillus crustosus]
MNVTTMLPSRENRRYIVVGGSGLVGNWTISHLVARGEDSVAIRALDLQPPRHELLERGVDFVKTNIVDEATAFLPLSRSLNVSGTCNVLNAARKAGVTCFISTSSGSVCVRRPSIWIAPWTKTPRHYVQLLSDATEPPEKYDHFFGTYPDLRRPNTSWLPHVIQNFVNAENVSIAHLLYEQPLIEHTKGPNSLPNIGGDSFIITDPKSAISFGDLYLAMTTLAITPIRFPYIPPVPMLIVSHFVEWYVLLQHFYTPWIPKVAGDIARLRPAVLSISNPHLIIDDSRARKSPKEVGLGYDPPLTSLDGVCTELAHWNRLAAEKGAAAMMGKARPY